jgi:hypothetical protein
MIVMRLRWLPLVGAVGLAVSSLATAADSFTAGVLSCAAETDRDRRLDCYDREVAGYTAGLAHGGSAVAVAPAARPGVSGPAVAPATVAANAARSPAVATPSASNAAPATASPSAAVPGSAPALRHFAGHVSSIEHFPDYVVVHLDNQQTWKQVSDSPGGLALRTGDSVTIDKEMGSWWLAGPKGEAVQVRLEAPHS